MKRGLGSRIDLARTVEHFVGTMAATNFSNILTGAAVMVKLLTRMEALDYLIRFLFTDDLRTQIAELAKFPGFRSPWATA